jgi:hypothetical protein
VTVQTRGDQVITQVFRLNHENPNNLVAVLRPLISPNNTINANAGNGTLVITDYADNLARIGRIIAALDQPAAAEVEVIALQHAVAADIAALLQKLGEGSAAAVPGPQATGTGTSVIVDARSNSLIVRTGSALRLAQPAQADRPTRPARRRPGGRHPCRTPEERGCSQAGHRAAGGVWRRCCNRWLQWLDGWPDLVEAADGIDHDNGNLRCHGQHGQHGRHCACGRCGRALDWRLRAG